MKISCPKAWNTGVEGEEIEFNGDKVCEEYVGSYMYVLSQECHHFNLILIISRLSHSKHNWSSSGLFYHTYY